VCRSHSRCHRGGAGLARACYVARHNRWRHCDCSRRPTVADTRYLAAGLEEPSDILCYRSDQAAYSDTCSRLGYSNAIVSKQNANGCCSSMKI
jgi:hypothetical protein